MKRYLFAVMMLAACGGDDDGMMLAGDAGNVMDAGADSSVESDGGDAGDALTALPDGGDGGEPESDGAAPMCPTKSGLRCYDYNTLEICTLSTGETHTVECGTFAPKCCTWGRFSQGGPFSQCLSAQQCDNRGGS